MRGGRALRGKKSGDTQAGRSLVAVRTRWGWLGLGFEEELLSRVHLPARSRGALLLAAGKGVQECPLPGFLRETARVLVAYFEEEPVDPALLQVPLSKRSGSAFATRIHGALRGVPRGQAITYGGLARRAGFNGAARAVGRTMARNRLPLIVPCHRVVGAGKGLLGFSAPGGLHTKARLLDMEGFDGCRLHS